MDLDLFYDDAEHTIESTRPNDFNFKDATAAISQDINSAATSIQSYYETKMWQWFDSYKQWSKGDKTSPMFEQPTLQQCSDEVNSYFREAFKASRENQVKSQTVTVDGMEFDGDELSRFRMATAIITALDDTETVKWHLANNVPADVTRVQLKEALRLSGKAMEAIWFQE